MLIFIILFGFYSCMQNENMVTPKKSQRNDTISVLCLGDSYTKGEGVVFTESFPFLLKDSLEQTGYVIEPLNVIAQTGWTTQNLIQAIDNASLEPKFDIITLLIGVNNQYQGRSIIEYETEFKELALTAVRLAGGDNQKVFILSIPDYGYTPFGSSNQANISNAINQFNATNKRISDSLHLTYFDITPITRQGLSHPELVASDNLHPSGLCYKLWVNQIFYSIYNSFN